MLLEGGLIASPRAQNKNTFIFHAFIFYFFASADLQVAYTACEPSSRQHLNTKRSQETRETDKLTDWTCVKLQSFPAKPLWQLEFAVSLQRYGEEQMKTFSKTVSHNFSFVWKVGGKMFSLVAHTAKPSKISTEQNTTLSNGSTASFWSQSLPHTIDPVKLMEMYWLQIQCIDTKTARKHCHYFHFVSRTISRYPLLSHIEVNSKRSDGRQVLQKCMWIISIQLAQEITYEKKVWFSKRVRNTFIQKHAPH